MITVMELDDKEAIKGMVSALDLEIAITDAINIYLREVLGPHGVIDASGDDAYPDHAGSERNELKYRIAHRVALATLGRVGDLDFTKPEPWV